MRTHSSAVCRPARSERSALAKPCRSKSGMTAADANWGSNLFGPFACIARGGTPGTRGWARVGPRPSWRAAPDACSDHQYHYSHHGNVYGSATPIGPRSIGLPCGVPWAAHNIKFQSSRHACAASRPAKRQRVQYQGTSSGNDHW